MPQMHGSGPVCGPPVVRTCVLVFALALIGYILGPPLYWHFVEGVATARHTRYCPPCICDCPTQNASVLPPGSSNTSADCTVTDPRMREELDKNSVELLIEELKLQAIVAEEAQQRADSSLLDSKKLSSQYQKEAEKCNIGMETCEGAREKAEEALIEQKRISALWKQRAKDLGWKS